jgi:hypothetical protein
MRAALLVLAVGLMASPAGLAAPPANPEVALPRFTEEREAAALFFVRKNAPDLLPLLEQLKRSNRAQYQHEIREIFQVTEMLADLQDDPRRHELELKIWKTENKAYALVARLAASAGEERKRMEDVLLLLAGELVDLDVAVLELKVEELDRDLGTARDELARARQQIDRQTQARYQGLLEQARKRRK